MSINIGISTLSVENDQDYGWKALGAASGTAVGHKFSQLKIIPFKTRTVITPIYSQIASEYLGDSDRLKNIFEGLNNNDKK